MATKKITKKNNVYFKECKDYESLRNRYIELVALFIEDDETMEAVTKEYDALFPIYQSEYNNALVANGEPWKQTHEEAKEARTIIEQLVKYKENGLNFMDDSKILIVGSWIWIECAEGKTPEILRPYGKFLASLGFRWNGNPDRKVYQWHSTTGSKWRPHKQKYLAPRNQIYSKYGSRVITSADELVG